MSEQATELDLSAFYQVAGWGGVAWTVRGYATYWTEEKWEFVGTEGDDPEDDRFYVYDEPEQVEDRERVLCVMVGDDTVYTHDVEDLTVIGEEDFCHGCGQIGCCW